MPDFSSIRPMNTNSGTAISSQLLKMPEKVRDTPVDRKMIGTSAAKAKITPIPASAIATG